MTLLFQVAGLVAAVVVASVLAGHPTRGGRLRIGAAAAAVAAVVGALAFWGELWSAGRAMVEARVDNSRTPKAAALTGPAGKEINVAFLAWAAGRIPPDATYAVRSSTPRGEFRDQWIPYQLLPRRLARSPRADWVVIYNGVIGPPVYVPARYEAPIVFEPGFAIARRLR